MYDIADTRIEKHFVSTMYACYTDILFIVFPFVLVGLLRFWNSEFNMLIHPEFSIATAILAGMSIGKLLLALISNTELKRFKLRFIFFIACIIFMILGPSVMFIVMMTDGHHAPELAIFIQSLLLILTIIIYSVSFNISFLMTKWFEYSNEHSSQLTQSVSHNIT